MLVCLPSALEEDEVIMSKPEISSRFDVEDIRKILEYNSLRHIRMTPEEIITEKQSGTEEVMRVFFAGIFLSE